VAGIGVIPGRDHTREGPEEVVAQGSLFQHGHSGHDNRDSEMILLKSAYPVLGRAFVDLKSVRVGVGEVRR
jgi:hypothetical protein